MERKRMPKQLQFSAKRPPKRLTDSKKAAKKAGMVTTAKLNAIDKWKKTQKGFMRSVYSHIGKAVDRIEPLEAIAIVGMTVIVHQTITDNEALLTKVRKIVTGKVLTETIFERGLGVTLFDVAQGKASWEEYFTQERVTKTASPSSEIDVQGWLVSFTIAYCIIKFGGQLLGLLDKGLDAIIGMMLV